MSRSGEFLVIVLDVGASMLGPATGSPGETKAKAVLAALKQLLVKKMLGARKDHVNFVFVGTRATRNALDYAHLTDAMAGGFEPVVTSIVRGLDFLAGLADEGAGGSGGAGGAAEDYSGYDGMGGYGEAFAAESGGGGAASSSSSSSSSGAGGGPVSGDVLDGVVLGVYNLTQAQKAPKGKPTYRVLLVTDGASPVRNVEQVPTIVEQLKSMGARMDVIGVDFYGEAMGGEGGGRGLEELVAEMTGGGEEEGGSGSEGRMADDEAAAAPAAAAPTAPATTTPEDADLAPGERLRRLQTQSLLVRMARAVGGNAFSVGDALALRTLLGAKVVTQVTKFRGDIDLGGVVKIPIHSYTAVLQAALPSFKKMTVGEAERLLAKQEAQLEQLARRGDGGGGGAAAAAADKEPAAAAAAPDVYDDGEGGGGGGAAAYGERDDALYNAGLPDSITGVRFDRAYYVDPRATAGAEALAREEGQEDEEGGAAAAEDGGWGYGGYGEGDGGGGAATSSSSSSSGGGLGALSEAARVDVTDLSRAYTFGKDVLVVSNLEASHLKLNTERQLLVLGFMRAERVPRYTVMGGTDVMVPAPAAGVTGERAMSAFARALCETGTVALVRHVRRKGEAPHLGILIPSLVMPPPTPAQLAAAAAAEAAAAAGAAGASQAMSQAGAASLAAAAAGRGVSPYSGAAHPYLVCPSPVGVDCLYFLPMPFREDIRAFRFPSFEDDPATAPSPAHLEAMDAFMDSLDLTNVPLTEAYAGAVPHGGFRELLAPLETFNPVLQRYYQALGARCEDPFAPLPPLDPKIAAYLRPDALLMKVAAKGIATLQARFGPELRRGARGKGEDGGEDGAAGGGYGDASSIGGGAAAEHASVSLPSSGADRMGEGLPTATERLGAMGAGRGRGGADPVLGHLRLWNELTSHQRARLQGGETEAAVVWGEGGAAAGTAAGVKRPRDSGGDGSAAYDSASVVGDAATASLSKRAKLDSATLSAGDTQGAGGGYPPAVMPSEPLFGTGAAPTSLVRSVGTARPVDDFWALLSRRDGDFVVPAVEDMSRVIERLANDPVQQDKALAALMELRVGCLQYGEEGRFNSFLRGLKAKFGPGPAAPAGSALWRRMVTNSVSLIASDDSVTVDVTPAEKQAFLAYQPPRSVPVAPPPPVHPAVQDEDLGDID